MNTVELKAERTKVKSDRKALASKVIERDLSDDEQATFDAMSAKLDALDKRIAVLESIEDQEGDDDQEDMPKDDEPVEASIKRSQPKHLDFRISTSKTRKDSGTYSIQRAIRQAIENGGRVYQGIEAEVDQEITRSRGGNAATGFYMPHNTKVSPTNRLIQRDLTTTTGIGGVGITTESTFIDLLRSQMVLEKLGTKVLTGLHGKINIPRQNAATQFSMIGEGVNAIPSNPTFDYVSLVPRTASAEVNISRKFIFESSFDAQAAVENDMTEVMARGIDTRGLNGNPSVEAASPLGILQNPGVYNYTVVADSGNGGLVSFADVLGVESYVSSQNVKTDSLAWVMTPQLRGKLKATPKVNGGTPYPEFVWSGDNQVNGYPAIVTTEMPSNLVKGTSSTCNSAIFGNWSDALLGFFSGLDVIVNPYTNATSGAVQIVMLQEFDFVLQHPQAWAIITDATLS